jgi:hypothetical protein
MPFFSFSCWRHSCWGSFTFSGFVLVLGRESCVEMLQMLRYGVAMQHSMQHPGAAGDPPEEKK